MKHDMQVNEPDVSVIIPVFNAERVIERSIHSVVRQEMIKIEIICIDDGSTDASVKQIQVLQENYPQIVLLEQKHQGAGSARNAGISAAQGRYIAFLDADDEFVDVRALRTMVKACDGFHVDICGSLRMVLKNEKEQESVLFENFIIPEEGCFIEYRDFQYDYDYQSFIFNRNFLIQNSIFFPPYLRYQDPPFFARAMVAAGRFYVVPVVLYKYRLDICKKKIIMKHMVHVLRGIYDNLKMARSEGYHKLFENNRKRVENDFYSAILLTLSNEVMKWLLAIDEISREFDGKELKILSEIYQTVYNKEKSDYSNYLMHQMSMIKQSLGGFRCYFEEHKIQTAAVYGLGVYGKILIQELRNCGVKIVCGIDQKVSNYEDLPVIKPERCIPKCDALIVSMLEPEAVALLYQAMGNCRVYTFVQIIQEIAEEIQKNRYRNCMTEGIDKE